MNALSQWLKRHASSVSYSRDVADHVRFYGTRGRSAVTINSTQSYDAKLAALLHECGHVIIHRRRWRNLKKKVCGISYREWWVGKGRYKSGSNNKKLYTIYEELYAWELGAELAKKLNIRVLSKVYHGSRTRALLTYTRDT